MRINYLIHSDGKKEFIGKPISVKYNYGPNGMVGILKKSVLTIKPAPKRTECKHRFPMEFYFMYSSRLN